MLAHRSHDHAAVTRRRNGRKQHEASDSIRTRNRDSVLREKAPERVRDEDRRRAGERGQQRHDVGDVIVSGDARAGSAGRLGRVAAEGDGGGGDVWDFGRQASEKAVVAPGGVERTVDEEDWRVCRGITSCSSGQCTGSVAVGGSRRAGEQGCGERRRGEKLECDVAPWERDVGAGEDSTRCALSRDPVRRLWECAREHAWLAAGEVRASVEESDRLRRLEGHRRSAWTRRAVECRHGGLRARPPPRGKVGGPRARPR